MIECAFFGEQADLHHVGLAVKSIRELYPSCEVGANEDEGISFAFVSLYGIRLELLEPLDETSPIARSLREGVKLLHLCYEVPDLDAALACGRRIGFHRLKPIARSVPLGNRRVAWVFSRQYGLFELLERADGGQARESGA